MGFIGSTGQPKGVLQTHRNFLTVVQALYSLFDDKIMNHPSEHVYYAFLPLAHTFELIAEMVFFGGGIAIGYGSATTMVDEAPGLKKAVPGDLKLLRPTVMCSVPLVLDRIRKKVEDRFASSAFETQLFDFILSYKTFWKQFAMDTPILNHLVCQKAAAAVGGRVQFMIVGGAPLSVETQKLIENFLNIRVLVVSPKGPKDPKERIFCD